MNMLIALSISTLAALGTVGCSHSPFKGVVTEDLGGDQVKIHLSGTSPTVGEQVTFLETDCHSVGGLTSDQSEFCRSKRVGEGTVTASVGKHDAIVRLEAGHRIALGSMVTREEVDSGAPSGDLNSPFPQRLGGKFNR